MSDSEEALPWARGAVTCYLGRFFANPEDAGDLFALGVADTDLEYDPYLQKLHRALRAQHLKGGISLARLRDELQPPAIPHDLTRDEFDKLADYGGKFSFAQHAAKEIIEARSKRRLFDVSDEARRAALNGHSSGAILRSLKAEIEILEHDSQEAIELPKVSSIESRAVDWAWPGWLPKGMLTLCDGDPERGKSQITCDVAARWTYPRPFPFATGDDDRAAGNVLLIAAEDNADTTIRPRLEAAGANLDRVYLWPEDAEPIKFPNGIDALAAVVKRYDIGLAVLDPLGAYLAEDINANRDADVRRALRPLVALAQETNLAVLAVRHLNKDENKSALYRGGGSIAFTAAARVVWAVGSDPGQPGRMILAVLKSNIAVKPPALSYTIEGVGTTSRIRWEGESTCTAGDIFGRKHQRGGKTSDAKAVLQQLLANGPRPESEVWEECDAANIGKWPYKQARKQLGIVTSKGSMREGWLLSLPEEVGFEENREEVGNHAVQQ